MVDISIVIPLFNEETRIGQTLEKIISYLKKTKKNFEVILVDDGSVDDTEKVVRTKIKQSLFPLEIKTDERFRIIKFAENLGKGWAVREGVLAAKGKLILFTDADLATPIEEELKLREKLENGYDVAMASRVRKDGSDERSSSQPLRRRILGKFFNLMVNLLVVPGFSDTQCGFKMFTAEAAKKIFPEQKIKRIGFDVELLYLAKKKNLKIAEVPVKWQGGKESRMNIFRELGVLKDVLWIRFSH